MTKLRVTILCFVVVMAMCVPVFAAPPTNLTLDGKQTTLSEIAKTTGNNMVDANGKYTPLYYTQAVDLWNSGLFLGSNGSFDLDNQLTRAEGVVMTIRILGKDSEAKNTSPSVTFTDVPDWAKSYVAYAVKNGIANGYSDTTFGSGDAMTAAQYLTLVLRAMGYQDGSDFTWSKSYDKALEIGLIGQPCHAQYSRTNLFLRDNAAVIAHNALYYAPTKSGGKLIDEITIPGKPSGSVPTAVRAVTITEPGPQIPEEPKQPEQGTGSYLYYDEYPSVPTYDSVDAAATGGFKRGGDNYAYYAYQSSSMNADGYKDALVASGFSSTGTINVSSINASFKYYKKGNIHVIFGKNKSEFHVRIAQMEMGGVPTTNELRALYTLFNK